MQGLLAVPGNSNTAINWSSVLASLDPLRLLPIFVSAVSSQFVTEQQFDPIAKAVLHECGHQTGQLSNTIVRGAVESFFTAVDWQRAGVVDWHAVLVSFVALSGGDMTSKLSVVMAAFDTRGRQALEQHQLFGLVQALSPGASDTQMLCHVVP